MKKIDWKNNNFELKRIEVDKVPPEIANLDYRDHLSQKLAQDQENAVIASFRLCIKKIGYVFEQQNELNDFIKQRCRIEDYQALKYKIFYVDDTPVMKWDYELSFDFLNKGFSNYIEAEFGKFYCLV